MKPPSHVQWLLALGGWTVFVWFQRIGNVLGDDDLSGFAQVWRLVVAVGFVAAGAGLVGAVVAGQRSAGQRSAGRPGTDEPHQGLGRFASPMGVGLAAVGSTWWVLRGGQILIGDWDLSFKAVHTVLAVVVVGLSVMVWRTRGYDRTSYG